MLETYCGEKVFEKGRPDPKLVCLLLWLAWTLVHLLYFGGNYRLTILKMKSRTWPSSKGDCKAKELDFYHGVIVQCLTRHSKRPTSQQVLLLCHLFN